MTIAYLLNKYIYMYHSYTYFIIRLQPSKEKYKWPILREILPAIHVIIRLI